MLKMMTINSPAWDNVIGHHKEKRNYKNLSERKRYI